jgi:hypothetical protein
MASQINETKPLKYKKQNEALLVNQIDYSLGEFMKTKSLSYVSFTPPSTDQNFSDLDKYCGDIIASLDNLSALVLEVKFNTNGHLNDLNPEQKSGLVQLRNRGVPVFYSYNSCELAIFPKEITQQLLSITAIEPQDQQTKCAINDPAKNLKDAVEKLLSNTSSSQDFALALASFVDIEESIINSGIENLTTKALLLIYDKASGKLASLGKDSTMHLIEMVMNKKYQAESKNAEHLTAIINELLSAWRTEDKTANAVIDNDDNDQNEPSIGLLSF